MGLLRRLGLKFRKAKEFESPDTERCTRRKQWANSIELMIFHGIHHLHEILAQLNINRESGKMSI